MSDYVSPRPTAVYIRRRYCSSLVIGRRGGWVYPIATTRDGDLAARRFSLGQYMGRAGSDKPADSRPAVAAFRR